MSNTTTITGNLTREPEIRYTKRRSGNGPARRRRQPALAGPDHPGVAGGDLVLRRRVLARPGRERGAQPLQGHARRGDRPHRAAQLGDRRGRAPIQGRDRGRRDRPVPALRHGRRAADRASPGGPSQLPSQERTSCSRRSRSSNSPGSAGAVARLHAGSKSARVASDSTVPLGRRQDSHAARTLTIRRTAFRPTYARALPTQLPSSPPEPDHYLLGRPSATSDCFTREAFEAEPGLMEGAMMVAPSS